MTFTTAVILALYFIQESLGHALPQSPIVGIAGGHAVNIEDARFMAALLRIDTKSNDTLFLCGGSIVHPKFVLTSALCAKMDHVTVRVGSSRYDEGGELHQVEKYITHESYSDVNQRFKNNVGLLKLSEPVTLGPSVAAIKLAVDTVNIRAGLTANVSGWGYTNNSLSLRDLQQGSVTVSTLDDCNNFYKNKLDKQICVSNVAVGGCFNDFGDPLTAGGHQIGILSYGFSCWNQPAVYESVAPHLSWIRNKIRQNL